MLLNWLNDQSYAAKNNNGQMIYVVAIYGCCNGYKYYARYKDCQRKN